MLNKADVYAHGVGSSCKGDQYHHEVYHLVVDGVTLCGVPVRGKHWWKEYSVSPHHFQPVEWYSKYISLGDAIICQRCAKANVKGEH